MIIDQCCRIVAQALTVLLFVLALPGILLVTGIWVLVAALLVRGDPDTGDREPGWVNYDDPTTDKETRQ